ncbi:MAG: ECF-type sigma factor [Phycisphaerae bacterium]
MPSTDVRESVLAELSAGASPAEVLRSLVEATYSELREIAHRVLYQQAGPATLRTTALVHEAYVKLARSPGLRWESRGHFLRIAAKVMRHVVINYARAHRAQKRGGRWRSVDVGDTIAMDDESLSDLLDLSVALEQLSQRDRQKAEIVELRYFAGCSIEETADALGIGTTTVEREWRFARAWLRAALGEPRGAV